MCSALNVYMLVYILIGTHMVPLRNHKDSKIVKMNHHFILPLRENMTVSIQCTSLQDMKDEITC